MKKYILLILSLLLLSGHLSAQMKNDTADTYQALRTKLLQDTSITVYKNKPTEFNTKRDFVKIGGLGIVIAGSVAATLKFKQIANNAYDNYVNSLSQSELDKSDRYDRYAMISLIVMEAAFACLVYLLFFDK